MSDSKLNEEKNMEKNTVILDLLEYNILQHHKRNIEEGKTCRIPHPTKYISFYEYLYPTEAEERIKRDINNLKERNEDLHKELNIKNQQYKELKNEKEELESLIEMDERVSKMSIWEFIKYKRIQKKKSNNI